MSFYLEVKGPKVQDWEASAKNKCCSLKILNLREYAVCSLEELKIFRNFSFLSLNASA
jgi:hypothetical protein